VSDQPEALSQRAELLIDLQHWRWFLGVLGSGTESDRLNTSDARFYLGIAATCLHRRDDVSIAMAADALLAASLAVPADLPNRSAPERARYLRQLAERAIDMASTPAQVAP
jgi:hypothetical protein